MVAWLAAGLTVVAVALEGLILGFGTEWLLGLVHPFEDEGDLAE